MLIVVWIVSSVVSSVVPLVVLLVVLLVVPLVVPLVVQTVVHLIVFLLLSLLDVTLVSLLGLNLYSPLAEHGSLFVKTKGQKYHLLINLEKELSQELSFPAPYFLGFGPAYQLHLY